MKHLIIQFSEPPCYFLSPRYKLTLWHTVYPPSMCIPLDKRGKRC